MSDKIKMIWTERAEPEPDPGTTADPYREYPITFFIIEYEEVVEP